jgi:hypothetical protein
MAIDTTITIPPTSATVGFVAIFRRSHSRPDVCACPSLVKFTLISTVQTES